METSRRRVLVSCSCERAHGNLPNMSSDGASVSSLLVRIVVDAAKRRGLSDRAFRRAMGLSSSVFERSPRVPIAMARKVWTQVPLLIDEPELGVLAAEEAGPSVYGFFNTLAECSATWGIAMERLIFCVLLANRAANLSMTHGASKVAVVLEAPNGVRTGIDLLSTSICLKTRAHMGEAATPLEVRYAFEKPRKTIEYDRVFGVPVQFGAARTELVYDRSLYCMPVPGARTDVGDLLEAFVLRSARTLAGIFLPHSHSSVPPIKRGGSFLNDARLALQVCMEQGAAQLSDVATVMGISSRSLQRHLRESESSLRALVGQQRAELAMCSEALRSKAATARLLGYSDRRALRRAQTRWCEDQAPAWGAPSAGGKEKD